MIVMGILDHRNWALLEQKKNPAENIVTFKTCDIYYATISQEIEVDTMKCSILLYKLETFF